MNKNEEMGKELEKFESETKSGDTKGVVYKPDSEMESLIRLDFLKEKYGEERINEILKENGVSPSDLSIQGIFIEICNIAES
jgi:hypothetical protein